MFICFFQKVVKISFQFISILQLKLTKDFLFYFQSSFEEIKDEPTDAVDKSSALSGPTWTENISWPCQRCDVELKGISGYMQHLEDFHPEDNGFFCPFCEQGGFDDKKELRRHVMKEHKVWTQLFIYSVRC